MYCGKNWVKKPVLFLLGLWGIVWGMAPSLLAEPDEEYRSAVYADWSKQEAYYGRNFSDPAAIEAVRESGEKLLFALTEEEAVSEERLDALRAELDESAPEKVAALDENQREARYLALRWEIRTAALENPQVTGVPILFHKGDRFVCQMLHENMSFFNRYTHRHGGGLYVLKNPGQSFEIESLTDGFPMGLFSTPSLSFDAKTIYFAFADFTGLFSKYDPVESTAYMQNKVGSMGDAAVGFFAEYMSHPLGKHHLFKIDIDGKNPVQLTDGNSDDFDPVEIPGGDLVFESTRIGGFGRCHGTWEPLPIHTLHRLAKDGNVTTLSWHETNEWHPSVLHDGRILYTRWDYVDRSASRHHGLWITNPDGTGAMSLFGNYTFKINACYQAKEIPGSNKILFVPGAHHLNIGGPLAILDPAQVKLDPEISEDIIDCVENITPEIEYPEAPKGIPDHYYHSPWPLSEDFYLTAFSHDPLGGYISKEHPGDVGRCGIYYRDRFGNLELLYEDESISCQYPIPIAARDVPPQIPSQLPAHPKDDTGTLFLSNVYESLLPMPEDRPIKELRVFEILPKGPDHRSDSPKVGHANAQNARVFLGTVPVESDGSAYFRVPAKKALMFQAVDESGRAVMGMRSEVYLQPGENRGCVGCHEQTQTAFKNEPGFSEAFKHGAVELTPGPAGSAPFYYPDLVQPVLDRACLECHDSGKTAPDLTGGKDGIYTVSYNQLKPYLRWFEWGSNTMREISSLPGWSGADQSPLSAVLDDEHHAGKISLSDEDRRILYLWMDANVPFYGDTNPR